MVSKEQYEALEGKFNQLTAALNQYFAQTPQTPAPQPAATLPDANLVLTDPEKWQANFAQTLGQSVAAYVQAATGGFAQGGAENAKALSQMDPKFKEVWGAYGKEIDALAASPQIPAHMKANKAFWDNAAKVVRGEHTEELVESKAKAKAQELAAQMGVSTPADSGGFAPTPNEKKGIDALKDTAYGKALLERYSPRLIAENAAKLGVSVEKFAEMSASASVIRKPGDPNEWRTQYVND